MWLSQSGRGSGRPEFRRRSQSQFGSCASNPEFESEEANVLLQLSRGGTRPELEASELVQKLENWP